jgi:hypothetical protein
MTVNASRVRALPDTDASVVLRNIADGAETSTVIEASVSLKELDLAWWHDGNEIPGGIFEVNVHVTALNGAGTNAYTLDVIVDDVAAMNDTPRVVATLNLAAEQTGFYKLLIDSKNIPLLDTDTSGTDKFIAMRATIAGDTSPSITYGAWIGKVRAHG